MKNAHSHKSFICGALTMLLLVALVLPVSAAVAGKNITIYPGITIYIDNEKLNPKDAGGNPVEVFTYNGTTYLPVRAVSEALGKDVQWDGSTRSVYIGESAYGEINWMQKLPPYMTGRSSTYDGSDRSKYFSVAGIDRLTGIKMNPGGSSEPAYAIWNTNEQYDKLTFTICGMSESPKRTLEISLNGTLSTTYDLKWDDPPRTITVPLNHAQSVKIEISGYSNGGWAFGGLFGIYNISFS